MTCHLPPKQDCPCVPTQASVSARTRRVGESLESDRADGWPNDPVARFHLGNGAVLEQLNFGADRSEKGMAQSGGLMVNYLYDLKVVEANHEAFHESKAVPLSTALKQLQRSL